ncbi:MAG: hypothetical protein GY710_19135 [Desulfobacteraceae bacterium]|nr:hypothetical protein [Desulfobacteraceae bacterium]
MKIISIDIKFLKVPLKRPYVLSAYYGTLYDTCPIVVKIETDAGITGYGETDPLGLFTGETPETVVCVLKHYLAPALIGSDPTNIAGLHRIMDATVKDMFLAKAALDIAAHDILGKTANLSVGTLLGGRLRESLPIMGSIGGGSPETNAREAMGMVRAGYGAIMIKVGGSDIGYDLERTQEIRKAVGPDMPLILDANQGWNVRTSMNFLKMVESCCIEIFEQPVPAADIRGLKRIHENTDVMISADESLLSMEHAKQLIQSQAVDIFSIKVSKNGGIFPTRQIIELAGNFGIDILFNSMIEEGITQAASFALGVATKNLYPSGHAYFSPTRLEADITDFSGFIDNGSICIPATPGLGIRVDNDKLDRYTKEVIHIS